MRTLALLLELRRLLEHPAVELADEDRRASPTPTWRPSTSPAAAPRPTESAVQDRALLLEGEGQPDKVKVIARQNAYHGVTLQAMSATGMAPFWKMFEPRVPGFLHIQAPYPYRFRARSPARDGGAGGGRELEEAILREGADTVAAFIAEPIIGGGGVIVPPDDYFPRIREICTKHDSALHRRRGHHRLLPDRPVVRADALERPARHPVLREER